MKLGAMILGMLGCTLAHGATPLESATELFQSKHYEKARSAFEDLLATDPQNPEYHFYLGVIATKRGDPIEAVSHLEAATTAGPTVSRYFLELGSAYGLAAKKADLLGKLSWARKCLGALQRAVALDPDSIPARNGLISFYREAPPIAGGGIDKAFEEANEVRKRDVIAGSAILGQLFASQRKYAEAFEAYEAALTARPDNYQMLYLIGRTAAETGENLERGEQALRRCLQIAPTQDDQGYAAVHWRLGHLAEKRHDLAAARTEYEAALREHPGFQAAADSLAKLNPPE